MGASHVTNYAKQLQFVQTLDDDNFGEVDVYRNQQGKFIMKCTKSFITGDKRHSDFIKVLEFTKKTNNSNIIPILYKEQYQQSNVCISYDKFELYSEYLNFTLQGLIRNKKTVEQAQMWYLIKTMLGLIQDLQREKMKMTFSLNNIFLTLKGIPSVFLYHFFVDNSRESSLQFQKNEYESNEQINIGFEKKEDNFYVEQNQQQQNITYQKNQEITLKPYCMHFCLAKVLLQLYNMQIIQTQNSENEVQQIKKLFFSTLRQNNKLGKIIKSLLINLQTQQILNQIKYLEEKHQIKLSTQIRFNKFRYIVTQEQKPHKDLTLSDNNLVDIKSKPITPINTPIYRLREQANQQQQKKQFNIKSKLLMSEQHFFKKKPNKNIEIKNQLQNFNSQKIHGRTKAYSIGGKEKVNYQQERNGRKTNVSKGSKLSLIANSRHLSSSKIQRHPQTQNQYFSSNGSSNQVGLGLSRQFYSHQFDDNKIDQQSNLLNKSSTSIQKSQAVKQKPSRQLKSTNRIKQILNEQILRSKPQLMSVKKSTLLNNKIHQQQSYKLTYNQPQKIKTFFKSQQIQMHTKSHKQQNRNKNQQSHTLYKPYVTEIQPQSQDLQIHEQKVKEILTLQNDKHSLMKESINALDKSNFLSTLQLKKSRNNLKVKQLTQRKGSIMSQFPIKKLSKPNNQTNQNIKPYLKQKIETKSYQLRQKKALNQISLNQNISSDRMAQTPIEKKKIKLRNDKLDNMNEKYSSNLKDKDQDKQNRMQNIDEIMMRNSKLRKVSIRAKGHSVK